MTVKVLNRIMEDLQKELGQSVSDIVQIKPICTNYSTGNHCWLVICKSDAPGIHSIYDRFGEWVAWSL